MTYTFLQLFPFQRILSPNVPWGWLAWIFLLALTIWIAWHLRDRQQNWTRRNLAELVLLALLVPVAIFLFTLRLPSDGVLPVPDLGAPALGPLLPVLAAIPWMLAAARFGALPGVVLAAATGLLLSFWDTRSPFTPLEFGFLAAAFATALSQSYHTRLFGWLRQPLLAAILLTALYPLLYLLTAFFWAGSNPLSNLDFAFSRLSLVTLSTGVQLLFGAATLHLIRARWPIVLPAAVDARQPAPSQRSLEARFLFTLGPVVLFAFLALGALGWWSAERSADTLISERMNSSVEVAADSVPFLLETGQNLMLQLAGDERLADAFQASALAILQDHLNSVPYFEQLTLVDTGGNTVAGVPVADFSALQPGKEEIEAISLAIQGVPLQFFSFPPLSSSAGAAQLSFVAAVRNDNDQVRGVLIGRTNLASNPFAQPIIQSLQSVNDLGGKGMLIDGDGRIVIAPNNAALLQPYNGRFAEIGLVYEDIASDGARRMVRYEPVIGSNWAVVAQWPASLSQQLALGTALPLLAVLVLLAIIAYALFRLSLRSVTASLNELVTETRRIASGDLKAALSAKGSDEIGRLSEAFDRMRQTLRVRSEENQRLLSVSQGIASSLDVSAHIDPILDAALASGASSARLVFSANGESSTLTGFGKGKASDIYQSLDSQILSLTRGQARVLISNPNRAKLKLEKGVPVPQAIAAFALADGKERLGALWLAYDQPQTFAGETLRYLETLADQAAKAAANTRLYLDAQLGRERLEAILSSTPDPILVSDQAGQVLLANPAAQTLFGADKNLLGARIDKILGSKALISLFSSPDESSAEVELNDGQMYQARLSQIQNGEGIMGHALVLRDISQFKQIESLRSDFLSTLSHDLHDPLELVRGYVSMLGMVGELNGQQASYVQKIEHSIENISRLTSSLLDMDRIQTGQSLQLERFELSELIQEVSKEIEARARQKKMEIVLQAPRGIVSVIEADRTLMQRALYNLLDNAIKFSPRGTAVEVTSSFAKDKVTVAVKDHGAGIAPVDLPKLFDRSLSADKGTLGLAIVKSIVQRHHGRVWAESELGLGSTFFCELPLQHPKK
ncbi:MAG: ATP-binding protein [Anaerolineales bacterium]